jgi:phage baseplate assembly protein V
MSARTGGFEELAGPDLARRVSNMIRVGTVMAVDPAGPRVRVKSGNIETDWLRWTVGRAGGDRDWAAPEPGEQVVMACPNGDMRQGVILGSMSQSGSPAAGDNIDVRRTIFMDGTVFEYDRAAHQMLIDLGQTVITANRDRLVLECNGSSITLDASGIKLVGARIDVN